MQISGGGSVFSYNPCFINTSPVGISLSATGVNIGAPLIGISPTGISINPQGLNIQPVSPFFLVNTQHLFYAWHQSVRAMSTAPASIDAAA